MNRTAIIDASGALLRVVFTSDLAGENLDGSTTRDCPDDYPGALVWDEAGQDWASPPTPPTPPTPALHQLCNMLVAANVITLAQSDTIKAA